MSSGIKGAEDAVLEVDLGGIAVWDVSALLPRNSRRPFYEDRPLELVTHEFVHHSGRLGRPGFAGLLASTRYVVEQKPTSKNLGFPGCAYHLWLPFEECRDGEGRLVIFRANAPEVRSWHTGGDLNGFGESIALQGNTSIRPMSDAQVELLEAALPYRLNALSLNTIARAEADPSAPVVNPILSWHSEADRWGGKRKAACPGRNAVIWLDDYRGRSDWGGDPVVRSVA